MTGTPRILAWAVPAIVLALSVGPRGEGRAAGVGRFAQGQPLAWQDTIRNLRHPDAKIRLAAVEALGNAGYTAAAEPVAPLIVDLDDHVQFAAIDAELTFFLVESIGSRRILSFGASHSRAQEAFDAGPLVRLPGPAPAVVVDNLIAAIRAQNARIRFDAVHAVGVVAQAPLTPAQATALVDGLDHYDPVIRAATARVLGRLRTREAGDKLIGCLNDSSALVRRFAIESLGLIREERAVTALRNLFGFYGKGDLAAETLLALARIGHGSARDLFRAHLADDNPAIRRAAAEGLGRLGDRDSLGALQQIITSDPAAPVRLAARFAVGQFGEPQSHLIAASLASTETGAQARDYLLEIGSPAGPGVESALGVATDVRHRADLLHVLGFVGNRDAVGIIEPYLKDRDDRVARAAANAIARLSR
jgi:HEAT repeat protein